MELGEGLPAALSAETAVAMAPQWSAAWQTLGRSQLNIGEVEMVGEHRHIVKCVQLCFWFLVDSLHFSGARVCGEMMCANVHVTFFIFRSLIENST